MTQEIWYAIKCFTVFVSFTLGILSGLIAFGAMFHDEYFLSAILFFFTAGLMGFSFDLTRTLESEDDNSDGWNGPDCPV